MANCDMKKRAGQWEGKKQQRVESGSIPCHLSLDSALTRPQCLQVAPQLKSRSPCSQPQPKSPHPCTTPGLLPTLLTSAASGRVCTGKDVRRLGWEPSQVKTGVLALPRPSQRWRWQKTLLSSNQLAKVWECWPKKSHSRLSGWGCSRPTASRELGVFQVWWPLSRRRRTRSGQAPLTMQLHWLALPPGAPWADGQPLAPRSLVCASVDSPHLKRGDCPKQRWAISDSSLSPPSPWASEPRELMSPDCLAGWVVGDNPVLPGCNSLYLQSGGWATAERMTENELWQERGLEDKKGQAEAWVVSNHTRVVVLSGLLSALALSRHCHLCCTQYQLQNSNFYHFGVSSCPGLCTGLSQSGKLAFCLQALARTCTTRCCSHLCTAHLSSEPGRSSPGRTQSSEPHSLG